MTCYYPIAGWRARKLSEKGKRPIVFNPSQGYPDMPISVPCGQCLGCRLERSRQSAVRCVHEASLHIDNAFITLTYNNSNLPSNGSLVKKDFQDFMKRLRKVIEPVKVKYYMCGEYGEVCKSCKKHITKCECKLYIPTFGRPHFHAILFNYDFLDKVLHNVKNGNPLYVSEMLNKIWGKGFCIIGGVTFESAAYVSRYIMKKATGRKAIIKREDGTTYYEKRDAMTGEIIHLEPEYTNSSTGGRNGRGLAYGWYQKYKHDVYPCDYVIIRGKKMRPPKYYDKLYELEYPEEFKNIQAARIKEAAKHREDSYINRLRDREKVKIAQTTTLTRNQEEM